MFQAEGTVAVAASPGFGAILVATSAAIVGILNSRQLKILAPVWLFFLERRGAIANLNPARRMIRVESCILHIPQVLALGH